MEEPKTSRNPSFSKAKYSYDTPDLTPRSEMYQSPRNQAFHSGNADDKAPATKTDFSAFRLNLNITAMLTGTQHKQCNLTSTTTEHKIRSV